MAIPGEKFELSLDDLLAASASDAPSAGLSFIADIKEHTSTAPPVAPSLPSASSTGFPAHRKRVARVSRFKQQQQSQKVGAPAPPVAGEWVGGYNPRARKDEDARSERQRISDENEARIAAMGEREIEEERREIMEKLGPKMVEALLRRARLEVPGEDGEKLDGLETVEMPREGEMGKIKEKKTVSFKDATHPPPRTSRPDPIPAPTMTAAEFDMENAAPPFSSAIFDSQQIHFPTPPNPNATNPDLDPSDPAFFQQLHEKFFPDLPSDPSKLSWMLPVDESLDTYKPTDVSLTVSSLRFDFKGNILAPRTSRELPVFLGLHHHGDAPNAAGYTVPELARLARSTFPSQRCIAMQLLGRVLYKLGVGVYGSDVGSGLWRCVRDGRVLETLEEAAGMKGGSMSVKAYATEALWLWQKGGGIRPEKIQNAD
ncbi:hypothetical protein EX30DRAFT_353236 [Ascodesmis nigricans]|uniref:Uncharacterized protein n=1 Tax=Ascodesmis nigricans TaxID=341454 RepID=A0A4S2N702_9PEZI|nr:hypothetical protein EX30DRAFT_353236 [Ascodesmis nigricans]